MKNFAWFQCVDLRLFFQSSFISTIIAPAHPWFQADKRCAGNGPDAKIGEAFAVHGKIRCLVRQQDGGSGNLSVIQDQSVPVKHMGIQLHTSVGKGKSMWFLRNRSSRCRVNEKIGKGILLLESKIIIRKFCVGKNRHTEGRMTAYGEIYGVIYNTCF